jgi:SOS response regulatory protein OraA/RecX
MLELGVLDDEAFARSWVESRDRARPRGERAIRDELRLKGIDRAVIDTVLEERREAASERSHAPGEPDDGGAPGDAGSGESDDGGAPGDAGSGESADRAAAVRLLARHERALARVPDPRVRRQRAYALLARNGFDPDVCREVAATAGGPGPMSDEGDHTNS